MAANRGLKRHCRAILAAVWLLPLMASTGCATKAGEMVGKVFDTVGMTKPEAKDLSKIPWLVPLRIHAGENLNAGAGSTPLGLLVRVYRLKDATAFNAAPYESFLDPAREKEALGADLIESREVLLVPGQRYEVTEKMPREAGYLGVVALFQSPAPSRWKFAFESEKAQLSGIFIGALACALTVTKGEPVETPSASLSARCN